ncbi:MAG: 50S ribosomal protein L4 [Candidatus Omnitrophica bacterium]|nr:50S ribosomal protein L4 [Candidatus Omnitrophota bacterium]
MYTLPVVNSDGKEIETLKLDEKIFNDKILSSSVYPVICGYLANQRKGLASTKTRGEVSGGGKKPWKQKGTGRARVGSIRSPLWRHGGVIFGPHPRDFSYNIPVKMKSLALKFALSEKAKDNNLILIDALVLANPKTKDFVKILKALKAGPGEKNVLVVSDKFDANLKKASANADFAQLELAANIHTFEVLKAHKVVITKDGLRELIKRLK